MTAAELWFEWWRGLSAIQKREMRLRAAEAKVLMLEERARREAQGTCDCPDCQGTNE